MAMAKSSAFQPLSVFKAPERRLEYLCTFAFAPRGASWPQAAMLQRHDNAAIHTGAMLTIKPYRPDHLMCAMFGSFWLWAGRNGRISPAFAALYLKLKGRP
jgi:hypothetical protein